MTTLQDIRQKFPQYDDLSDEALADALHKKFYGDMPQAEFDAKIGFQRVGVGEDVGRGAAAGFLRGGLGLIGSIVNPANIMQGAEFERTIEDISGREFYDAKSGPGKVAQTASEVVPYGMAGGGGLVRGAIGGAVSGAASEIAGQATAGTAIEGPARIAAGLLTGFFTPMSAGKKGRAPPPTWQRLKEAGSQQYDDIRNLDVRYHSNAVSDVARRVQQRLYEGGFSPENAPEAWRVVNGLADPPPNSFATINGLEIARRRLRKAGKGATPTYPDDKAAAAIVRNAIDEFVEAADPATVLSGPADQAAQLTKTARANYAAGKRSQRLNELEASSELRAASTYSGQNLENNLRARARDIVDPLKPWNREGFNAFELALIEKVARGTKTRNVLRYVGNLLGGQGGFPAAVATGTAFLGGMGPAAIATPAIGAGLKTQATRLTQKGFRAADEAVRSRSPLAQEMQRGAVPGGMPVLGRAMPSVPIAADVTLDYRGRLIPPR